MRDSSLASFLLALLLITPSACDPVVDGDDDDT